MQKPAGFSAFVRSSRQLAATYLIVFLLGLLLMPSVAGFVQPNMTGQTSANLHVRAPSPRLFVVSADSSEQQEKLVFADNIFSNASVKTLRSTQASYVAVIENTNTFPKILVTSSPDSVSSIRVAVPLVWGNYKYAKTATPAGTVGIFSRQTNNEISRIEEQKLAREISRRRGFVSKPGPPGVKNSVLVAQTIVMLC